MNMPLPPLDRAFRVRIMAARALQLLGWHGVLGVGLLLAAAGLVASTELRQREAQDDLLRGADHQVLIDSSLKPSPTPLDALPSAVPTDLPSSADVPALTLLIARTAVEQGLGWPQADYRVVTGGEERSNRLEVRCTLKAPYPVLRRFLAVLFQRLPSLTLREFTMSRANSDTAEVEAKLTFAVLLAEGPEPSRPVEALR